MEDYTVQFGKRSEWGGTKSCQKLLGLDRDRYAEVHGAPKQKEKKKGKPPPPPPPQFTDKKGRAIAKFKSVLGKHAPIQVQEKTNPHLNKPPK